MALITYINIKHHNRRVLVYMNEVNGVNSFMVETRKLIDFKTRKIAKSQTGFTPETFLLLAHAFEIIADDSRVSKVLNRASGVLEKNPGKGYSNIK